jgi:hypothetical protein
MDWMFLTACIGSRGAGLLARVMSAPGGVVSRRCPAPSPTEILRAWRAGAAAVKLFPVSVGGPAYLRPVKAPLPEVPLVGDAGKGGDLGPLRRRAHAAVAQVREAHAR